MANSSDNKLTDLINRIKDALENLVTLEIITAVGQVKFKSGPEGDKGLPDLDYSKNPKVILTKINLLQGDIKTVYDPEFVTGNLQELKAFHKTREDQGNEIIKNNLERLQQLFNLASELLKEKPGS